jgi:hypothetical protein
VVTFASSRLSCPGASWAFLRATSRHLHFEGLCSVISENVDNLNYDGIFSSALVMMSYIEVNICGLLSSICRLFDFDRAISMKSGLRPAVCGCSGIVSGVPSFLGSGIRSRRA